MADGWITPWWQAALLPEQWDVCGLSVPSLTVWHTFALENVNNRYFIGGIVDMDDAASMLLFASNDKAGGKDLMLKRFNREKQMVAMHKRLKKMAWADVDAECRDYFETCTRTVDRFNSNGSPACVPYQWHLVRALSGCDPTKFEAAWNTPYAEAKCIYDALAESNGDEKLMSPAVQHMTDHWPQVQEEAKDGTRKVELVS